MRLITYNRLKCIELSQKRRAEAESNVKSETSILDVQITHTPSTNSIIDAMKYVENYDEFRDSWSELPDSECCAGEILTAITDNVDKIVNEKKTKKLKDKSVKHEGVTRCIPVETDSNADDDSDFPRAKCSLFPTTPIMAASIPFRSGIITSEISMSGSKVAATSRALLPE